MDTEYTEYTANYPLRLQESSLLFNIITLLATTESFDPQFSLCSVMASKQVDKKHNGCFISASVMLPPASRPVIMSSNPPQIPVLVDLPGVGSNLQDHPAVVGLSWTVKPGSASRLLDLINPAHIRNYIQNRQGPLTNPLAVEGYAWGLDEEGDPYWPEFQYLFFSGTPAADAGLVLTDLLGFRRDFFQQYFGPIKGKDGFNILPLLARQKSRGTVRLRSGDPHESPLIDPNFLSHPDDVAAFIRGKYMRVREHMRVLPGCEREVYGSDSYWACYTRHTAKTMYHPAGTCKMAPSSDPLGVVDHTLKLRGVRGVRVVDASIMPQIVTGNLNAPTIMIGERAADLIKQDWGILI
nr:glucose dehydrogenase [FAD, quinone]-like [Cherax quadricarinatus]